MVNENPFFYISQEDALNSPTDPFYIFAKTDALIQYAGAEQKSFLHFWRMKNTIILGMMDTKLPFLKDGLESLAASGENYFVRNSGGLAVAADEGVLNVSLIFPENEQKKLTINAAYEIMEEFIVAALKNDTNQIKAYEVATSYCPGDYDLSINGKKFAGIAQRRVRGGLAVMIYLSISGPQQKRGEIIRDFYQAGLKGQTTKWHFPDVDPNIMANLNDLIATDYTVESFSATLIETLQEKYPTSQFSTNMAAILTNEDYQKNYQRAYASMEKRNDMLTSEKEV